MNADGSNQQLVYSNPGLFGAWYPTFSPDGTKIAFGNDADGDDEIYVINVDGTNLQQLTNNRSHDYGPDWSPDGTKIAFSRIRFGTRNGQFASNGEVYVMSPDGSNQTRLTRHGNDDFYPIWPPDGSQIVFSRGNGYAQRNIDIYLMNADGSNVTRLTHEPGWDMASDWLATGGQTAYHTSLSTPSWAASPSTMPSKPESIGSPPQTSFQARSAVAF